MLITSLFGGAGAGMAGKAMMNRMGDLKEFDFVPLGEQRPSMHITIAVTGWITHDQNDYTAAWTVCYASVSAAGYVRDADHGCADVA